MSKAISPAVGLTIRLATAAAAGALVLTAAQAEITAVAEQGGARPAERAQPAARPPMHYQIRCWQQGRLIFDEHGVALPKDMSIDAAALRGRDRQQRPIYVVETSNATCFVRPSDLAQPSLTPTLPYGPPR